MLCTEHHHDALLLPLNLSLGLRPGVVDAAMPSRHSVESSAPVVGQGRVQVGALVGVGVGVRGVGLVVPLGVGLHTTGRPGQRSERGLDACSHTCCHRASPGLCCTNGSSRKTGWRSSENTGRTCLGCFGIV